MMGAEDFAYMLEARPGAFIFCGNGDSAGPASSRLQFQRRGDRVRHLVLDQAGREHAGGGVAIFILDRTWVRGDLSRGLYLQCRPLLFSAQAELERVSSAVSRGQFSAQ